MNKYTFYWLTGDKEILCGDDPADAMNKSGYGGGSVRALDFYATGENNNYVWDSVNRSWERLVCSLG